MAKFYKLKIASMQQVVAVHEDEIRAVTPTSSKGKYLVWLNGALPPTSEALKRYAVLSGLEPVEKDCWECSSPDLDALFVERK